jgi:hypothetical protein
MIKQNMSILESKMVDRAVVAAATSMLKLGGEAAIINIARRSGRSTSAHSKKFARSFGAQLRLLFRRKFFHRFDEFARVRFAQREWVVRSERDALRAK